MKNNASIQIYDLQCIRLRDERECDDLFGPEYIKEFGVFVPPNLIKRHKKTLTDWYKIQDELNEINETRYK